MRDALIFGASGGLGIELVRELEQRNMTYVGTFRTSANVLLDEIPAAARSLILLDATKEFNHPVLKEEDFDFAISTMALSDVDKCFFDPLEAFKANVMANLNAYIYCIKKRIPFYFISSNDVFAGHKPDKGWSVTHDPHPRGTYAKQKVVAEKFLLELYGCHRNISEVYIVRTSLISFYNATRKTFFVNILDAIKAGKEIYAATDQLVNPMFVRTVASELLDLITVRKHLLNKYDRFIHIAPNDFMSRYDFVNYVWQWVKSKYPKCVHQNFKITPCLFENLREMGLISEVRPEEPVLCPFPISEHKIIEELKKALESYHNYR